MADELTAKADTSWVRRPWCVWVAVGLLLLGAVLNVIYLFNHCPLELSDDESHYWMWAQRLDYGYYSKPPGIAWVIAAAQWVGGHLGINGDGSGAALMPVLRMPAVLFGIFSGLLSIGLARKMFRDDRAALAVILLSAAVPMFAVGSLLITIDSPMYLCWAGTVYCLWSVVSSPLSVAGSPGGRRVFWLYAAGVCAAVGMMFKPVLIALPLCVLLGMWWDGGGGGMRRAFKTWHALGALGVMMLSLVPVVVWNAHHGWVTFLHIGSQGFGQSGPAVSAVQKLLLNPLSRVASYVGGQAGGMGGLIFLLLVLAVIVAWKEVRRGASESAGDSSLNRTRWVFLLVFTLPLWGFYFVMNLWKGTEVNWPAASYFTGMVMLAGVAVQQWHSPIAKIRRDWRGWSIATVIWGMLLTGLAMNATRFYPLARSKLQSLAGTPAYEKSWWNPRNWDRITVGKLRGRQAQADAIEVLREKMMHPPGAHDAGQEPLLIAGRYDTASALTFYLPGHPFVFCLMSNLGGRQSQFDLWPGLEQRVKDATGEHYLFAGRDALLIGIDLEDAKNRKLLEACFERIGDKETLDVTYDGIVLRQVTVYRAWGFRAPPVTKGHVF